MSPTSLTVLRPREASIFACLVDTVVTPVAPLPAVRETDAVAAFDTSLRAAPAINRAALRAALLAIETLPRLRTGTRLRRLPPDRRAAVLAALDRDPRLGPLVKALRALAYLNYYGDTGVMRIVGFDPDAVVARGAALRAAEGRW
jgi:hypothetical protein